MLISVNQFRSWLRESAKTLREGGATATADVYEEIEGMLASEMEDIRDQCEEQIENAETVTRALLSEYQQRKLQEAGLMVVPSRWRQASCQSDAK